MTSLSTDSGRSRAWALWLASLDEVELVAWDVWQETHEVPSVPWTDEVKLGDVYDLPNGLVISRAHSTTTGWLPTGRYEVINRSATAVTLCSLKRSDGWSPQALVYLDQMRELTPASRATRRPEGWYEALRVARGVR